MTVPDPVLGATLTVVNVVPRLSATPGRIAWLGPALGQHNEDVYCGRSGSLPPTWPRFASGG